MQDLLGYIRRYRIRYCFGIACTVATATLAMVIPYLVRDGIDAIEARHFERLESIAFAICAAACVMGVTRCFSRFVIFNCGRDIEYDIRNELFARLVALGPGFYERFKTGDLMSRAINDLSAVRLMVGIGVLTLINTPIYYLYALGFMLSLNARLTLAALTPYALLFIGINRLTHSLMERNLRVQEELGAIGAKVQESLTGIHVVKAYALEDHEAGAFRQLNDVYNEQGLALARLRGVLLPVIRAASALSVLVVLTYGGSLIIVHQLSIGDLAAFIGYLGLLAWPTTSLGWILSIFQRGKAAVKRLNEIMSASGPESVDDDGNARVFAGEIEWRGVSFSYQALERLRSDGRINGDELHFALKNINVRVPAGGKLAIVGRTGSGKSTMIKLLARLIEPTAGTVLLDGQNVRELPLGVLRRAVGVSLQEATLFSDTLARNIALGRSETSRAEIELAALCAGLEDEIEAFPRGLDTLVGERGMSLSGGQKQRLTVARLIAYEPSVAVLDDALASVDAETEHKVLRGLGERVRDRTTIIVSNRASVVRDADEIIVLDHGEVAERGTHEELMAQRGVYAGLFQRQLLEEELENY